MEVLAEVLEIVVGLVESIHFILTESRLAKVKHRRIEARDAAKRAEHECCDGREANELNYPEDEELDQIDEHALHHFVERTECGCELKLEKHLQQREAGDDCENIVEAD